MTTSQTKLLGLLGWPVAHSRSPRIHTAALEALSADAVYLAFAVPPDALAGAVSGLRSLGARGFNVTVPHKRAVMDLLDEVEPTARAIGAVNTVTRDGDRLVGSNTDAPGFVRALEDAGVSLSDRRALVVGAGGAARAVVAGLARSGARSIDVAARRLEDAEALVAELNGALASGVAMAAVDMAALRDRAADCDLLVQATSATMGEGDGPARFAESLPIDALPGSACVVDIVYAPLETAVLARARARGLTVVDGLGMLVGQAALSLERWLSVVAPLEVMRRAARAQ